MKLEVSSVNDIGKVRSLNQDAILAYEDKPHEFGLFVVADGMGGHSHGERASGEIVSGMREWIKEAPEALFAGPVSKVMDSLLERLRETNRFIWNAWNQESICGSTCVLLMILRDVYGFISVGDSRIYRSRGFHCGQITRDDVWENQDFIRARFTEEQLREHPNYGKLLHAVGGDEVMSYSMETDRLQKGDVFALCSDGIYKMCPPRFFQKKIRSARRRPPDAVRDEILEEVYRGGARDNASLILVRCG